MYLLNLPHTLANIHWFVRNTTGRRLERHNFKQLYVEALIQEQGHVLSQGEKPVLSFLERKVSRDREPFERGFGTIRRLSEQEQAEVRERLEAALTLLQRVERRLHDMVCLLITDVVLVKGDKAAAITADWMLGVISMLPSAHWDAPRYADNLVHEALHTNILLAERVYTLYRGDRRRLAEPDARVPSAIREGQMRPLDGAFHSACVALGVAYLYHRLGHEEEVIRRLQQLLGCVQGLATKAHLLSDYANAAVEQMQGFLARPDFEQLGQSMDDTRLLRFSGPVTV